MRLGGKNATYLTHRRLVLVQDLVVLRHGDAEDDRRDVLEAVDPLLPLRSLSPDVEQPEEIVL